MNVLVEVAPGIYRDFVCEADAKMYVLGFASVAHDPDGVRAKVTTADFSQAQRALFERGRQEYFKAGYGRIGTRAEAYAAGAARPTVDLLDLQKFCDL